MKRDAYLYQYLKAIDRFGLFKPPFEKNMARTLESYDLQKGHQVHFVQIGSNDGLQGDPLHPFIVSHNWKGILAEPQPPLFEKLVNNYAASRERLFFENIAVSRAPGYFPFYFVDPDNKDLPEWLSQLSSFNREVILKHADYYPRIADHIKVINIKTDSFDKMLERNGMENVDLIHIDTEGHDFEILKSIDLDKYKPEIIIYEQKHLAKAEARESVRYLRKKGFRVRLSKSDCIAIRKDLTLKNPKH